jgi:uncharacterized membrane protein
MHLVSLKAHFQQMNLLQNIYKYDLHILPSISYCIINISLHLWFVATIRRIRFFFLIIGRIILEDPMFMVNWSSKLQAKGTFVYRKYTNIVDGCFRHKLYKRLLMLSFDRIPLIFQGFIISMAPINVTVTNLHYL